MTINLGELAPDFSLPDADGNIITLSSLRGKRVVLYFYPRDNTPGCTKEACAFKDFYTQYQSKNIVVLGINSDDAKAHTKFIKKYQLPFPLLCDEGAKVATAYESYGLKKFMGKEYMGVHRHTVVIAPDGTLEKIYRKVKPETHAAEILADIGES
jgi:thioredoxin-dependent peroxiredoxin